MRISLLSRRYGTSEHSLKLKTDIRPLRLYYVSTIRESFNCLTPPAASVWFCSLTYSSVGAAVISSTDCLTMLWKTRFKSSSSLCVIIQMCSTNPVTNDQQISTFEKWGNGTLDPWKPQNAIVKHELIIISDSFRPTCFITNTVKGDYSNPTKCPLFSLRYLKEASEIGSPKKQSNAVVGSQLSNYVEVN